MFRRRKRAELEPELLGSVSCPSGDVFVFDFGLLRLWSGDESPILDDSLVPAETAVVANAAADFEIVGPDAAAVATALDLAAVKGRFAFDVPDGGAALIARVETICQREGLQARVEQIGRIPHRHRLLRLLEEYPDGAEVPFHGVWGVAVRGLPQDRPLPLRGVRMDPTGPDAGRWHSVWVECSEHPPAKTAEAGYVLVDEARLMFADPGVLNEWVNDDPLDGRADLAFWGRDASEVAARVGAAELPGPEGATIYGWADLPMAEVVRLGGRLEEIQRDPAVKFRVDYRPHDHHHAVLEVAATSTTESGTIELAGATITGFFTTWGDRCLSRLSRSRLGRNALSRPS